MTRRKGLTAEQTAELNAVLLRLAEYAESEKAKLEGEKHAEQLAREVVGEMVRGAG